MKKGLIGRMKAAAGRIREFTGKVLHGTPEETAEERKMRTYGIRGIAIAAVALVVGLGSVIAVNAASGENYYRINPMGGSVYKVDMNGSAPRTVWSSSAFTVTVDGKITNTDSSRYGKYTFALSVNGFDYKYSGGTYDGKTLTYLYVDQSARTDNYTVSSQMVGLYQKMNSYFSQDYVVAGAYYSGHKLYGIASYVNSGSSFASSTPAVGTSGLTVTKTANAKNTFTYTYTYGSSSYQIVTYNAYFTESSSGKYTNIYYLWGDSSGDPYTISYYSASGSSNKLSYTTDAYYNYPVTLTTSKPTKTGYTFKNWNTSADGSGTSYSSGGSITVTADKKLYAQWTAKSQTVTFNNNGSTSTKTLTYDSGTNYSLTAPTRTGYTFKGWYTGTNGSGTKVWNADGTGNTSSSYWSSSKTWANNSTSAMTVYAYWVANTYTITFHKNGGSGTDKQTMDVTYGDSAVKLTSISSLGYTKTGYTFSGWATSASSTTVKYVDKASVSNLTADLDLYAVWTVNSYTITYDGNGNTNTSTTMSNTSATYGKNVTLRTNKFKKTGYTFLGWSTDSSATTATYTDGQTVSNLTSTKNGTVTLYAVWEANTITVKYFANGGSGTTPDSTFTYGVPTPLSTNGFTRTGYTFVGWYAYRTVDSKYYYKSADGSTNDSGKTTGWYYEGDQPDGWVYYVYKSAQKVSATASSGTVYMYSLWSKDGAGWTMEDVIQDSYMFYKASSLVGGDGTTWDGGYIDSQRAKVDEGTEDPGYFTQDPY